MLWIPGALAWVVSVGWLPFVLAVVPLPSEGDLTVFGASIVTSGAWPWNAVALAGGAVAVLLVALLLLSTAEVALLHSLRTAPAGERRTSRLRAVGAHFFLRVLLAAPVGVALLAVVIGLAATVPDELQSPDIGGVAAARIAGRLLGPLAVLLVVFVGAAVLVAVAGRAALASPGERRRLGPLRAAAGELWRRPLAVIGTALATLAAGAAYLVGVYLLLRVLWAPLADTLTARRPIAAVDLLLLVGFVAIWLCLILAGGALQAWASAWWTLELVAGDRAAAEPGSPAATEGPRTA